MSKGYRRWIGALALLVTLAAASSAVMGADRSIPASSLFDTAWGDPSPFSSGLVAAEQTGSSNLLAAGATVYHVYMTVDASLSTVSVDMEMAYTNREDDPLNELVFRAFPLLVGGSIDGLSATVHGQTAAAATDAASGVLTVALPEPLEPGGGLVVHLSFLIRLPDAPTGHYGILESLGDSASLAHVLPIAAVYDEQHWRIEPPPAYGDVTYADIAFFLVRITAPSELTIVASGVEIERSEGGLTQSRTYAAGPAREFYVTVDANLDVVTESVGEVTVNSYAPPELGASAAIALGIAAEALRVYEDLYGAYPYTELDVVASPIRAGGMEFPGVVLVGEAEYGRAVRPSEEPADFFELAVAHEIGHQWFYNLVGSDQISEPWLDEAVTQYATWRYFDARYGAAGAASFANWVNGRMLGLPTPPPAIGWPVSAYSAATYGPVIYARGPQFLKLLELDVGRETFDAFLRTYVDEFRWQLVTTETFRDLLASVCSCDLALLFAEWVYGN